VRSYKWGAWPEVRISCRSPPCGRPTTERRTPPSPTVAKSSERPPPASRG